MQITLNLPDELAISRKPTPRGHNRPLPANSSPIEQAAQLIEMDVDDFYQILVDRGILTPPDDQADTPDELIRAHLRISLKQINEGNLKPISELFNPSSTFC
jgi:hypothetical protein